MGVGREENPFSSTKKAKQKIDGDGPQMMKYLVHDFLHLQALPFFPVFRVVKHRFKL